MAALNCWLKQRHSIRWYHHWVFRHRIQRHAVRQAYHLCILRVCLIQNLYFVVLRQLPLSLPELSLMFFLSFSDTVVAPAFLMLWTLELIWIVNRAVVGFSLLCLIELGLLISRILCFCLLNRFILHLILISPQRSLDKAFNSYS